MLSSETEDILSYDEETWSYNRSLPCDPKRRLHRYLMLIFICFLSFGSYFCYDNPVALEKQMLTDLNINAEQYMNFYSWYSWPNVVLSFVGGFLIDRVFGIRLGAIIFSLFVLAGQLVFAGGAYANEFYLAVFGRFLFGVGGESLAVTQNTYASVWFHDSELNFIFGLQLSMSRIGSTVNMNSMEPIYEKMPHTGFQKLGTALFVASTTCVFSLLCAIILGAFDLRAEKILQRKKGESEKMALSDIRFFSWSFWLICGICVTYYVAVFPFLSLSKVFLIQKYNLTGSEANVISSLLYIISAACSPVAGFIIDLTGRNLFWVLAGTAATLGSHALFAFTFFSPVAVMVFMGIAYSILASSLWPMVALVIPSHQRGTAFGIMQSIQNLGLAVVGILAGIIQDKYGFLILEVSFSMCLCITLVLSVLLYLYDIQNGSKLNESGGSRRRKLKQTEVTVSQTIEN